MVYSEDEILSSLRDCYNEQGKVTIRSFSDFDGPSSGTVINRFGTFNNALEKAGIPKNDEWNNYSRSELLEHIREIAEENGSIRPKYFGGSFADRGQIDREFGSIGKAAGEANCHKYLPEYFECQDCGGLFMNVASHILSSNCSFSDLSKNEKEIYKGILMGDGFIGGREGTPFFSVSMSGTSGKKFTAWLSKNISINYNIVKKELNNTNHNDVYTLRTQSHKYFNMLSNWYDGGKKKFPSNMSLTPTSLKMWYVSDGSLSSAGPIITAWNESDRYNFILSLFENIGLSVRWQSSNNDVYIRKESQKDFFNYIGDPVPGFKYKWPSGYY